MIAILLEAALRSLFVGLIVIVCLRAFRIRNVFARKGALGLVLVCAVTMPLLIPVAERFELVAPKATIVLPSRPMTLLEELQARILAKSGSGSVAKPAAVPTPNGDAPQARELPGAALDDALPSAAGLPDSSRAAQEKGEAVKGLPVDNPRQPSARSRVVTISPEALIFLTYLAVAAVLVLRLALGMAMTLRLWLMATPIRSLKRSQAGSSPALRASARIASPLTVGSAILLPADYETWDEEKLRVVLAHERSHIRQGDFYLQVLASLYAALVWFSPLGWWLKRELADLSEAISDLAGIEQARTRTSYAEVLLEFAAAPRPTELGVAMARSGSLSRRIERLLSEPMFRQSFAGRRRALTAAVLVPAAFLATALVRVQAASHTPAMAAVGPVGNSVFLPNADESAQPETPSTAPEAAVVLPSVTALHVTAVAEADTQSDSRSAMSFDRTLSAGGDARLIVATGSGDIHLTRGSGSQVHIRGHVHVNDDGSEEEARQIAANPPIEQSGNLIRVGQQHEEHWRGISIDYEIEAPESVHLEATSGSGNIVDEGVGQNARIETGSGDIQANGLQGPFIVKTGSGNITAEQIGEGDVKAETGSGNIEIKDVHGSFHARTGSGDIKASGTPSAAWTLGTGSGNIEIWSGNAPVTLEGSTGSGSVSTDHEMVVKGSFDHHHITGTLNGGGPVIHVETGSGDIHVH